MPDKSVVQKLLIKPGYRVLVINAPENYADTLADLPEGAVLLGRPAGPVDLVQLFVKSRRELEEQLEQAKAETAPKGLLWVTYPKGTSRVKADINRDSINEYAHSIGLEGVAMIAVDDTWSALRLKKV